MVLQLLALVEPSIRHQPLRELRLPAATCQLLLLPDDARCAVLHCTEPELLLGKHVQYLKAQHLGHG